MKPVLGVIVGNRGFFPDELAREGRNEILGVLNTMGCEAVILDERASTFGTVETLEDVKQCAQLFKDNADRIDGIVVALPNFGDERGVADTLKRANLNVPVLIQASPDDPNNANMGRRRDSFCGKISVCNNLRQYNIPFSLTQHHTVSLGSDEFRIDLDQFLGICRVVKGMKNARIGAIGARPGNFNTVRFSEKILEHHGISVDTLDLSELFGRIDNMTDTDSQVTDKLSLLKGYSATGNIEEKHLLKMAKLGVVIDNFVAERELDATAIQCWTSMETYFGVVPCTIMSLMSNNLIPSACEVDVTGAMAMLALQLASGTPSALLDWNNNYGDDPDKCVLFHCSNLAKHFFNDMQMDFQEIIAGDVGKENTYGTCVGRIKSSPMTFARFSTDDTFGELISYIGEGEFTDDPLTTFGGYGVASIPNLQDLLKYICTNGFEHHVAASLSQCGDILYEAFTTYLDVETYYHK